MKARHTRAEKKWSRVWRSQIYTGESKRAGLSDSGLSIPARTKTSFRGPKPSILFSKVLGIYRSLLVGAVVISVVIVAVVASVTVTDNVTRVDIVIWRS